MRFPSSLRHFFIQTFLIVTISQLFSGCCFVDFSLDDEVAESYASSWTPIACKEIHHTPTQKDNMQAVIKRLEDGEPWHADGLVDIALSNNPDTRTTWELARAQAFRWRASRSLLYPEVNLSEQLLGQKIVGGGGSGAGAAAAAGIVDSGNTNDNVVVAGGGGSGSTYNQWVISTLSFSYLMLDFGGRMAAIDEAREVLFNADWTHNRNIQTVMLTVLTSYYQHLEATALYRAKELDFKEAKENLTSAEQQFDAGVVTIVDVLQAKSAYVNIQFQLEQLNGLSKTTLSKLATAMGMPANVQFEVAPLPEELPIEKVDHDVEQLIATAKAERPDLAAAEANWKAKEANVKVARSSGMPIITANGIAQDTSNVHLSNSNSRYYSGSILLNIPLFSGFFYVNQTRNARANAAAAYSDWKSQEDNALLEVVTSYTDLNTAVSQVKFADENFFYAEKAYEAALANYKFGVNTILDVLAAESALSNARAQKIQSRTFWVTSLTTIAYATGTL